MINLPRIKELISTKGDHSYADVVISPGYKYYQERVLQLGLMGGEKVLDIGCGFGQWSFVLAEFNNQVLGVDPTPKRIEVAKKLAEENKIKNVDFQVASFEQLEIEDQSLDIVFCYGVYMFLNRHKFEEFCRRVLKPNGRVYICTNNWGWWLKLFLKNIFLFNWSAAKTSFKGLLHHFIEGYPNSTSQSRLKKYFSKQYWMLEGINSEGFLTTGSEFTKPLNVYGKHFFFIDQVIEGIFIRKPILENKSEIGRAISDFKRSSSRSVYNETERAIEHIHRQRHLAAQRSSTFVEQMRLLRLTTRYDRIQVLKEIFQSIDDPKQSSTQRATKIYEALQKHFYHGLIGQPLMSDRDSIFCPITNFLIKTVRCGNSARFAVDLFQANGWPARLITLAAHTIAEVYWDGKWHVYDLDLFNVGHKPLNKDGDWASLEELIERPDLLDAVPSYNYMKRNQTELIVEQFSQTLVDTPFEQFNEVMLNSSAYFAKSLYNKNQCRIVRYNRDFNYEIMNRDVRFGWYSLLSIVEEIDPPSHVQLNFKKVEMLV